MTDWMYRCTSSRGRLSYYPEFRAACHWHEDLEFIRVQEGEMDYFISGNHVHLDAGDCLFVNARQLHYGYGDRECIFLCVLVHPSLLTGSQTLYQQFVMPLIGNGGSPYQKISPGHEDYEVFASGLDRVIACKERGDFGYELDIAGVLCTLVARLTGVESPVEASDPRLTSQKRMVSYIAAHYGEELSLEQIADSASVSKSTCCRLFREYTGQTPLGFLNAYRLRESCYLLAETDLPITEIASRCGFNHMSYFARLFRRSYGCSPSVYRRIRSE